MRDLMKKDQFRKLAEQKEEKLAINFTQYVQVDFCSEDRCRSEIVESS